MDASAQQSSRPQRVSKTSAAIPTLAPLLDTTLIQLDTLTQVDSTNNVPKSGIETEILYFAEDSIITDFTENKVYLYKNAWFEYGTMRLDADRIVIDWKNSELYAYGIADSLGVVSGNPFFKDGNSVYEIRKEMRYNFKTQKAIIKDVVTEQQDGVLRGTTIKKTEDGSVYLDHGYYTTCKLTKPHWHISSSKIKSISSFLRTCPLARIRFFSIDIGKSFKCFLLNLIAKTINTTKIIIDNKVIIKYRIKLLTLCLFIPSK